MQNIKTMMLPMIMLLILVLSALSFAWQGIGMHNQVPREESKLHALQNEYFTLSKSERESAPTGSELNQKLVQIQNYPSSLMELKLIGVGKILTGNSCCTSCDRISFVYDADSFGKIDERK